MTTSGSGREPLEKLAEEFTRRYRSGERPTVEEYAERHPELAEGIRELFPALMLMEEFGSGAGPLAGGGTSAERSREGPENLGEYRIVREIGRGGMGVVYEAVQESLGRHVALKVMPFGGWEDPVYRERFRREAQAAARLHHSNIVPVFGVGEDRGIHYYAMQFIQGHSLAAVLQEVARLRGRVAPASLRPDDPLTASIARGLWTGRFTLHDQGDVSPEGAPAVGSTVSFSLEASPAEPAVPAEDTSVAELTGQTVGEYYRGVARLGAQVAEALAYAHQHGIIHRDVKPSNLLLDTEGTVWITDFGLAKAEGSNDLTGTGELIGTLRYMAPERFCGTSDPRADVYGLGATLYEMLALRPAFPDADRARLVDRILHHEPPAPRQLDPLVPRDLETIVLKAMAKDPAYRYVGATELADDLHHFIEDRPICARRASAVERTWRWCRRNPALATASGLAVAALVATAALSVGLAVHMWRAADLLAQEQALTAAALRKSERLTAGLTADKSLELCRDGDVGRGLLWLARCLDLAVRCGDPDLEEAVRLNLALWRQQISTVLQEVAQGEDVLSVAASPDGRWLLTGSASGAVRLWDATTGAAVGSLRPSGPGEVRSVAFSPTGQFVAAACDDGPRGSLVSVWRVATRHLAQRLPHGSQVRALAYGANDRTLLTACTDGAAQLWDPTTGTQRGGPLRHGSQVLAAALSRDGTAALTGCQDGNAYLWDLATGKLRHRLRGHKYDVRAAAISPNGKVLLTGSLDRSIQAWEASTGKPLLAGPTYLKGGILTATFSPDGTLALVGCDDGQAHFLEPATWQPAGRPIKQHGGVSSAVFAPDRRHVVTGTRTGGARLWRVSLGGLRTHPLPHPGGILAVALGPQGRVVVTAGIDGTARLWASDTGLPLPVPPLRHPTGAVEAVAISSDEQFILTGGDDKTARLWRASDGRVVGGPFQHDATVWAVAFHPDGGTVATSTSNGIVQFWDTDGRPRGALPFQGMARSLAFGPRGQLLLTGSWDYGAQLWDAHTLQQVCRRMPHQGGCRAVTFGPRGDVALTGSGEGNAKLWDTATGRPIGPWFAGKEPVSAVAFHPAGRLFLAGTGKGSVRLWHAPSTKPVGPTLPLPSYVYAVGFSPDGKTARMADDNLVGSLVLPSPVAGDPSRVALWVEVLTGMELAEDGAIRPLNTDAWQDARRRLDELGGPPMP